MTITPPKRILLIEDDAIDSMIIRRALTQLPYAYEMFWEQESWNALERLKSLKSTELPDLIFLDLKMPRMDGFQFLEEIRTIDHLRKIPVVIVSTSNGREDREKAKELGALTYIEKTVDFNDFLTQLRDVI